ncbi:hypothetical protein ACHQM5_017424 [Ranunculus cassubicifolius]
MGSCMSTKKPITPPAPPPQSPPLPKDQHLQDRTLVPESDPPLSPIKQTTTLKPQISHPSPPLLEEETVKEVLSSETPTTRPNFLKYHPPDQQKILRLPSFPRIEEKRNNNNNAQFEEVSEVSDVCSLSESISTSVQSREYEEIPQPPRFIDRSPSKIRRKRSDSGEFYGRGESPVRRSEQWLGCGRTDIAGKSVYITKEAGNAMSRQPQRSLSHNRVMRDQGESSRRRSRSPAHSPIDVGVFRPAGICQSPSGRRIVRSTGRSPVKAPPEIGGRHLEGGNKEEMWRGKESLEDPLVSLECFIFL